MSSWTTLPNYSVGQPLSVSKMDQTMDNFIVAGCHGHTGAAGDGAILSTASALRGASGVQQVRQYIVILPFITACDNRTSFGVDSTLINGGKARIFGNPPLSACAKWNVDLDIGTWTTAIYHNQYATGGILSVCINGASVGQIDTYNSATVNNVLSSASSFTISASGTMVYKLECFEKNVSSTNYICDIMHIELRRLSA